MRWWRESRLGRTCRCGGGGRRTWERGGGEAADGDREYDGAGGRVFVRERGAAGDGDGGEGGDGAGPGYGDGLLHGGHGHTVATGRRGADASDGAPRAA